MKGYLFRYRPRLLFEVLEQSLIEMRGVTVLDLPVNRVLVHTVSEKLNTHQEQRTIATAEFLITTSPVPGVGFGALCTVKGCAAGAVIQAASFSVILQEPRSFLMKGLE